MMFAHVGLVALEPKPIVPARGACEKCVSIMVEIDKRESARFHYADQRHLVRNREADHASSYDLWWHRFGDERACLRRAPEPPEPPVSIAYITYTECSRFCDLCRAGARQAKTDLTSSSGKEVTVEILEPACPPVMNGGTSPPDAGANDPAPPLRPR